MDERKSKVEGWRKMGLGMGAITALSFNPTIDFKIAVIIGVIAIVGITWLGVIDFFKENKSVKKTDSDPVD